jgi:peroxiredoxin
MSHEVSAAAVGPADRGDKTLLSSGRSAPRRRIRKGCGRWRLDLLLLAGLLGSCASPVAPGDPAPEFSLAGLDGGTVHLADLRGKIGFLHFWATWCPPCLEELPQFQGFIRRADADKAVFLAVSVDRVGPDEVRKFLSSWGLSVPVYLDPGGKLARRYGTIRYPETYVLDEQGIIRMKVVGAGDWASQTWAQFLQNLSQSAAGR